MFGGANVHESLAEADPRIFKCRYSVAALIEFDTTTTQLQTRSQFDYLRYSRITGSNDILGGIFERSVNSSPHWPCCGEVTGKMSLPCLQDVTASKEKHAIV